MEKGQVSLQVILAALILLIILGLVIEMAIINNETNTVLEDEWRLENECIQLSGLITKAGLSEGSWIYAEIKADAQIKKTQNIFLEGRNVLVNCRFYGNAKEDKNLRKGEILIKNTDGNLVFSQV